MLVLQIPLVTEVDSTQKVNCSNVHIPYPLSNRSANCSSLPWDIANVNNGTNSCSVSTYNGSVCKQQLLSWQECAVGGSENVYLDMAFVEHSLWEESERNVAQFLHFLRELGCCFHFMLI